MRVLALDTATSTGVAIGGAGWDKPKAWSVDLGKKQPWPLIFSRMLRLVERYVDEFKPNVVAVEAPASGQHGNPNLIMLAGCALGQAAKMGVRPEVYYPNSVRKHFLGRSYVAKDFPGLSRPKAKLAIKNLVIARCRLLGWTVENDDAADAAALLDFALANERVQVSPAGDLFARVRS